jgi:hypothetical protein
MMRVLLLATGILVMLSMDVRAQPAEDGVVPQFVTSEICANCHERTASAWRGSHHHWAWRLPDGTTVLGNFEDAVFEHKGVKTKFSRRDGAFLVETEEPDGEQTDYQVVGVAGVAPLQQYLVETEPGRLQALDVAWDAERRRWYHLYGEWSS